MSSARINSYIILLIVSVIWGIAGPVIKYTLQGIDPLPFVTYRFFLSSIFAFLLITFTRPKLDKFLKYLPLVVIYSIFSTTISLGLLFLGMDQTTLLDTVLISTISPLVVAEFGVVFLKEHLTRREKTGISLALVGTIFTMAEPFLEGVQTAKFSGNLLIFLYLITNAFAAIFAKKLARKEVDTFHLSNISFIIGFITILPITILTTGFFPLIKEVTTLPLHYQVGVFYMALFSGTIAYALWIKGQKAIEVSEAGVFGYLTPLFQAPLAIIWLKETVNIYFIIGGIFIATGVLIAEYKKRVKIRR